MLVGLGIGIPFAKKKAGWSVASLFSSGENGVWYDPSDFPTMYVDSAGTTPVTAVGQSVGLILDKSKGLVLGPELVTNGMFDSDTAGWVADVLTATSLPTLSSVGGVLRITSTSSASYGVARTSFTTEVGKYYNLVLTYLGNTPAADSYVIRVGTTALGYDVLNISTSTGATVGTKSFIFRALSTTTHLCVGLNTQALGDYIEFDNISVKELPGNHAYQATTATKPTLQVDGNGKYYLAFDGFDDFLQTAAINFSATDKMSCWVGYHNNSTANGMLLSTGVASTLGSFFYYFQEGSSVARWSLTGTTTAALHSAIGVAGKHTASCMLDISGALVNDEIKPAIDGIGSNFTVHTAGPAGTGNFSSQPLTLCKSSDGVVPFNGNIYALIVRGALSDAAQIANAETYVNSKTGAY
jgi:hypothetical protein